MRVLLLNQFYAPDVAPTAQVLADLARTLVERGHQVEVVCSRRSYDRTLRYPAHEQRDGVQVRRLPAPPAGRWPGARGAADGAFLAAASGALLRGPRPHLVLSLTTPPFLGLWARAAANLRGARHAHWVMDVYPDVLAAHGWIGAGGAPFRALQSLARLQLEGAALVLGLGPMQSARLAPYARADVPWVPLWSAAEAPAPPQEVARARAARGWEDGRLVLLYAGNLGRGHAAAEFLEAARRLGPSGPQWAFSGGGPRAGEVAALAAATPQARVQLLPYVERAQLAALLGAGDVHLASVRAGWQGLIVPSKVQAAFAAGRPVIFVGPADSDPAVWIAESGGGWRVDEGDVPGLLQAVEAASDASERARRGHLARAFAGTVFDRTANCARIAALLEAAAPPGSG